MGSGRVASVAAARAKDAPESRGMAVSAVGVLQPANKKKTRMAAQWKVKILVK